MTNLRQAGGYIPSAVNTSTNQSRPRLILLGASNLTRGISTVVETARLMLGSPLEIHACMGHGRSYGQYSTVFGRTLPGILNSGIWETLSTDRPAPRTFSLITDIGNDIMYGSPPLVISQWVEQCADKLAQHDARIVITALPIDSIRSVRPWQYVIVKSLLFPTRRITFEQAMSRAIELHDRIAELARRRDITLIDCEAQWYGFDPIHIRGAHKASAWARILAAWTDDLSHRDLRAHASLGRWLHLATRTPESWRLLGLNRGRPQPCGRLADGTTIALF